MHSGLLALTVRMNVYRTDDGDKTVDHAAAVKLARKFPGLKGMDLAKVVSTKRSYQWNEGTVWPDAHR